MQHYNKTHHLRWLFTLLAGLCTLMIFQVSYAQPGAPTESHELLPDPNFIKSRHPYCGLYDIYTVMKLSGKEIEFAELVKPEYVGSRHGSTVKELIKAAEDNSMYAEPAGNLTSGDLKQSPYPIILHVKSSLDKRTYDHFELFLDTQHGKARIFNPPQPIKLVPFDELEPYWDGRGLIVSATPISTFKVFSGSYLRLAFYGIIGILIILIIHRLRNRFPIFANQKPLLRILLLSLVQCIVVLAAAYLVGISHHFINKTSLLSSAEATAAVIENHRNTFIPKVNVSKAARLLGTDAIFIDARMPSDFEANHIEGAINIHLGLTDEQLREATADMLNDARIVVYSQSSGCKYAEQMAIKLIDDRFTNVSLFKDGWYEWNRYTTNQIED